MSQLRDAFAAYGVENPEEWLVAERAAETPSRGWSGELFDVTGFAQALAVPCWQAVRECGLPLNLDDAQDEHEHILTLIKEAIDHGKGRFYETESWELILLMDSGQEPQWAITILEGTISSCDTGDCAFALLASWKRHPDRVLAHKARQYLCDAVGKLIEVDN